MLSISQSNGAARGATFLLWALAAGSAAFWGLRLGQGGPAGAGIAAAGRTPNAADPAAVARLLGATAPTAAIAAPAPSLASRFALVGVVAGRSRDGAALIAVDGKPARPFRVGSQVEDGLWLQAVEGRRAALGASAAGPAVLTLELPLARSRALSAPAAGTVPGPGPR